MAKALLGYVGAVPDRRLVDEVTFLRTRVRDLEAEIARLQTERDMEQGLRQLSQLPEPALANAAIPRRSEEDRRGVTLLGVRAPDRPVDGRESAWLIVRRDAARADPCGDPDRVPSAARALPRAGPPPSATGESCTSRA